MKIQFARNYLRFFVAISCICLLCCQKEDNKGTAKKIIYTDIIPDTIVTAASATPPYNLDLDNDGVNDFTFECNYDIVQCRASGGFGFKSSVGATPADNSFNEVLNISVEPNASYPVALDTLNEIGGAGGEWSSAPYQTLKYIHYCDGIGGFLNEYGNWTDSTDRFLGLKLVKSSGVFYGWVRLNVPVGVFGPILRIKEYAYNSSPNEFILAGQKE